MPDFDCRHFLGDKPCRFAKGRYCGPAEGETGGCNNYSALGKKILIIKLGALGDVLRTTSLLPAIEKRFPGSVVAWITKGAAMPLLENLGIWRILPWGADAVIWAGLIKWDMVISLDKEEGPTSLAEKVEGKEKYGFGRNRHGLLWPLSDKTAYLFRLGLDDVEKFQKNEKTYPRLVADACGFDWGPNPYLLKLNDKEKAWAESVAIQWGNGPQYTHRGFPQERGLFVGLNLGSGDVFAGKKWPQERFAQLAEKLHDMGVTPVFLAGAGEKSEYEKMQQRMGKMGIFPGCEFDLRRFMALVSRLSAIVSGDTLAMHIGIALGIYSVAFFGSTTEREIEFYGRGEALVGKVHCSPCYLRVCPTYEECMLEISVDSVFAAVKRGLV